VPRHEAVTRSGQTIYRCTHPGGWVAASWTASEVRAGEAGGEAGGARHGSVHGGKQSETHGTCLSVITHPSTSHAP
jgi:hypothetical protein